MAVPLQVRAVSASHAGPPPLYAQWSYPPYGEYPYEYPPYDSDPSYGPWPYSDSEIWTSVWNKLAGDSFLSSPDINVEVHRGVVILTGSVDTWQDRSRAEMDAYAAGARMVINRLTVEFP